MEDQGKVSTVLTAFILCHVGTDTVLFFILLCGAFNKQMGVATELCAAKMHFVVGTSPVLTIVLP